jgi:hypothetical protein
MLKISLTPLPSRTLIGGVKGFVFRGKEKTLVLGGSRRQLDGLRIVCGRAGMLKIPLTPLVQASPQLWLVV